jgi:hypothetical protein
MRAIVAFFLVAILSASSGLAFELVDKQMPEVVPSGIVRLVERKTLRSCTEAENQSSPTRLAIPGGDLFPASEVLALLKFTHGIEPKGNVETKIVRGPRNGSVRFDQYVIDHQTFPGVRYGVLTYVPNGTFVGADAVEFLVRVNNTNFRVRYRVNVINTWLNGESCRPPGEDRG